MLKFIKYFFVLLINLTIISVFTFSVSAQAAPPQGISVTSVSSDSITIQWNEVEDANGYRIFFQVGNSVIGTVNANGTSFTITPVQPSTEYNIWMQSCVDDQCGPDNSAKVTQKTSDPSNGTGPVTNTETGATVPQPNKVTSLPTLATIFTNDPINNKFANLGDVTSQALKVVFYIATFLVLIYALYGIFQYIMAGGDKEKLAKARNRILWAFIGFMIMSVAFLISQYIQQIFPINPTTIQNVSTPSNNLDTGGN